MVSKSIESKPAELLCTSRQSKVAYTPIYMYTEKEQCHTDGGDKLNVCTGSYNSLKLKIKKNSSNNISSSSCHRNFQSPSFGQFQDRESLLLPPRPSSSSPCGGRYGPAALAQPEQRSSSNMHAKGLQSGHTMSLKRRRLLQIIAGTHQTEVQEKRAKFEYIFLLQFWCVTAIIYNSRTGY